MLLGSVNPLPGTNLENVIHVVETQAHGLANLNGVAVYDRLSAYQNWASQASSQLRYVFDLPQVEWLIDTRRHDFLFGMFGGPPSMLHHTLTAEQDDRARVFSEVLDSLRSIRERCVRMPEILVVPDTNVFLHFDQYFDKISWSELLGRSGSIRLVLPVAVMREIDRAKRTPGNKTVSFSNKESVRDRARLTSKAIREMFLDPEQVVQLNSDVSVELLLDPRGHRPIDDADSEIIERALVLQSVSGRVVSIVTSDGNMQFGARVAGLDAVLV